MSRTLKLHIKHLKTILPIHTYWDLNSPQALEIENPIYCKFVSRKLYIVGSIELLENGHIVKTLN